jgi:hypothetical protein
MGGVKLATAVAGVGEPTLSRALARRTTDAYLTFC